MRCENDHIVSPDSQGVDTYLASYTSDGRDQGGSSHPQNSDNISLASAQSGAVQIVNIPSPQGGRHFRWPSPVLNTPTQSMVQYPQTAYDMEYGPRYRQPQMQMQAWRNAVGCMSPPTQVPRHQRLKNESRRFQAANDDVQETTGVDTEYGQHSMENRQVGYQPWIPTPNTNSGSYPGNVDFSALQSTPASTLSTGTYHVVQHALHA